MHWWGCTKGPISNTGETIGIESRDRISFNIRIRVDPPIQPARVARRIPADCRVVSTKRVVMQPRLSVEDLAGEPEVVGNYRVLIWDSASAALAYPPLADRSNHLRASASLRGTPSPFQYFSPT